METAQFCKAYDLARGMGFHLARGVGGRLFVVWPRGTDGKKSKRFESIKAALAYCNMESSK